MFISSTHWGSPLASRRALLIHGLSITSNSWEGLAQLLVAEGFFVVAPNLLGHGWRQSGDYHMSALVEDLQPYFAMGISYDVIIGHSLGGTVALALLPSLRTKSTAIILVDPILEVSDEKMPIIEQLFIQAATSTRTVDEWMEKYPSWSRRDCILMIMGLASCDSDGIRDVFQHNKPWSFGGLFKNIPSNVKIIALIADMKFSSFCRLQDFPRGVKNLDVKALTGVGHCIQFECPEAIMDVIPLPRSKI